MTMYGQNKGHFKLENNECIGTGASTTLHKIEIAGVFFHLGYVILRRVFRHEILYYDVTMTYFVTKKTLHSTTYTK